MAEVAGHQTRQDRLRVPHYDKPIQIQLSRDEYEAEKNARNDNNQLDTSGESLVQTIKARVSNMFNRIIGR